jgi:hypothetical protein
MQIGLDSLISTRSLDWEDFLKWYNDSGWVGDEARRLTWTELRASTSGSRSSLMSHSVGPSLNRKDRHGH